MKILFSTAAWEDYLYFQEKDKKVLKKINVLIKDIIHNPNETGLGKTEKLSYELVDFCSRRITLEYRVVYRVKEDSIEIAQIRYHC